MERTTKKDRAAAARRLLTSDQSTIALVFNQQRSNSNPYINRVQIATVIGACKGTPEIVAEGTQGNSSALTELLENTKLGKDAYEAVYQSMVGSDNLSRLIKMHTGYKMTYYDGYVMIWTK